MLCQEADVQPVLEVSEGVEVTRRARADGHSVYFLLNHGEKVAQVALPRGVFSLLLHDGEVRGTIEVGAEDVVVLLEQ